MNTRAYKLRLRREMRMRRKQVGVVGSRTDRKFEKHLFSRLDRLPDVRRFMAVWLVLVVTLIAFTLGRTWSLSGYYQTLQPVAGGTYTEGVRDVFTTANPLYATSSADRTVSRLIFSGLFKYNNDTVLVGDLATDIQVDERARAYTVSLRDDVYWHDGVRFTAKDVVFTYSAIQNADAGSPLFSSWQGVSVTSTDDYTVVFTLTNPLASFKYSLVNGIVPEHILGEVDSVALRTHPFNAVEPIGTGPFVWQSIAVDGSTADTRQEQISLRGNEGYYGGQPALSNFVVKTYRSDEQLLTAYREREILAMVGSTMLARELNEEDHQYRFPLTAAMMTFFKTSEGILSDKSIRQALVQSVDTGEVVKKMENSVVALHSPLLPTQLGYVADVTQLPYDVTAAGKLLDEAGWLLPANETVRQKDGSPLTFELYAENSKANEVVSSELLRAWSVVGVQANIVLQDSLDFQTTLSTHSYDALLHGVSLGVDPDVYPYWHSSQADPRLTTRLNFSEYNSAVVDAALDAGRTRSDEALRAAKYRPFLEAWRQDAPAFALYQPQFMYVTREAVHNLAPHLITTAADRFSNVEMWMIRRIKTTVD